MSVLGCPDAAAKCRALALGSAPPSAGRRHARHARGHVLPSSGWRSAPRAFISCRPSPLPDLCLARSSPLSGCLSSLRHNVITCGSGAPAAGSRPVPRPCGHVGQGGRTPDHTAGSVRFMSRTAKLLRRSAAALASALTLCACGCHPSAAPATCQAMQGVCQPGGVALAVRQPPPAGEDDGHDVRP